MDKLYTEDYNVKNIYNFLIKIIKKLTQDQNINTNSLHSLTVTQK